MDSLFCCEFIYKLYIVANYIMKKYFCFIAVSYLFISCQDIEFFEYSKKELVDIHKFLPDKSIKYKSLGIHTYKKDTVSTYSVNDKYYLCVIKIDGASNNYKLYTNENVPFDYGNSMYTILERGNYGLYFNLPQLAKIGEKKSIHLLSDGKIDKLFSNDSIQVYSVLFENLTVYYNQKPGKNFFLRNELAAVKQLRADIAFYKKDNNLYFMILTSIALDNIKKGTLLEYIKL